MSPFRQHYDSFEPEALAVLEITFQQTWTAVQQNGNLFDQEATRTAVADLIIAFASQGEADPQKLKMLALAALPSHPSMAIGTDGAKTTASSANVDEVKSSRTRSTRRFASSMG
jgi:hypothetical protein